MPSSVIALLALALVSLSLAAAVLAISQVRHDKRKDEERLDRLATHEAGHALYCWICPSVERIDYARIGGVGGQVKATYRLSKPLSDADVSSVILNHLSGLAAEFLVYGGVRKGSGRIDTAKAIALAKHVIAERPELMASLRLTAEQCADVGESLPKGLDPEVFRVIANFLGLAAVFLSKHPDKLDLLRSELKRRRRMNHDEIIALLGPKPNPSDLLKMY